MEVVGERFSRQGLRPRCCWRLALQAGLALLKPGLTAGVTRDRGKVVIGTVRGDLRDIGKNLVDDAEGGFAVRPGHQRPPDRFVEAVRAEAPDSVMMSALLTRPCSPCARRSPRCRRGPATASASRSAGAGHGFADQLPGPTSTPATPARRSPAKALAAR
jgi:cobalamin-dependent methionine synthase I